jgi:hypothetical protein
MSGRMIAMAIAIAALFGAGAVCAQENLDRGKTPAQLFASDCAICHKSRRGLSNVGGLYGLQGFLRQHYTASAQSAAAIAAYLQAIDRKAPPARKRATRRPPRHPPAPKARPKPGEPEKAGKTKKSAQPDNAKPDADKPAVEKASEPKSAATAPGDSASSEAKASAPKDEGKPDAKTGSGTVSGMTPDEAKTGTSNTGTGDSVRDIIKPEKTE